MDYNNIVLFGAGEQNMRTAFNNLMCAGLAVKMIVDSDIKKCGGVFHGIEIVSPMQLREMDKIATEKYPLVITPWTESVIEEIKSVVSNLENAVVYTYKDMLSALELNYKRKILYKVNIMPIYHCNLNCASCSVCAPLADGTFILNETEFEKDLSRLVDLGAEISEFFITGGEPILHPRISKFPYIIKKSFPKADINLYSNGLVLGKMGDEFWKSCKDNDVLIMITRYPIKVDYDNLIKLIREKGIRATFGNTGDIDDNMKEMWSLSIDLNGSQDATENFRKCANVDFKLKEGRLYPCCVSSDICHLCKTFDVDLPWHESGVNIYEIQSNDELLQILSNPNPMCSFCDLERRKELRNWSFSKKSISEWIV